MDNRTPKNSTRAVRNGHDRRAVDPDPREVVPGPLEIQERGLCTAETNPSSGRLILSRGESIFHARSIAFAKGPSGVSSKSRFFERSLGGSPSHHRRPTTPEERKTQAEERRDWLRAWTHATATAEGQVPTIKRTREAMQEKFGRVLANAYINAELQRLREERGEVKKPVVLVPLVDHDSVAFHEIEHIAKMMFERGILSIQLNSQGEPVSVSKLRLSRDPG